MEYSIVSVRKENLPVYSELLSKVFTGTNKYSERFLDWQYFQNPHGDVVGFDAYYGNQLAAHYVTIPVLYTFNNQLIKGLLSLNTATEPGHQGKGLFTKLAMAAYEQGRLDGYRFVIGVANRNSTHGFLKKLGFNLVSRLDVKIYLGRPRVYETNEMMFCSSWDESSVAWRLGNPAANYFKSRERISSATHIKSLSAILSGRTEFHNAELQSKKTLLNMTIGLNLKNFKRAVRIALPEKLKPSPLNLIFKILGGFKIDVNRQNTYFELIDFDAY